jgi:hypothetical protein
VLALAAIVAACGGRPSQLPLQNGVEVPAPRPVIDGVPVSSGATPLAPVPTPGPPAVRQIAAGSDVTCALLANKTVRCWGDNQFSIVGGRDRKNAKPVAVPMRSAVAQVSVGAAHACARHEDGTLSCWGSNYSGEIGLGTPTSPPGPDIEKPTLVPGVSNVTSVVTSSHSAALLADKTVMFWGDYDSGSGDPRPAGSAKPAAVVGLRDVEEIADTGMGACARLTSGAVRCWYMVSPGLIPRGKDRVDPVAAPVKDAVGLYPEPNGMCASTRAGKLVCWNSLTQLSSQPYPGLAKLTDLVEIAFGGRAACARRKGGALVCEEQDGAGTGTGVVKPIEALAGARQIVAGGDHFCALDQHDRVLCWGENGWGQLGDGTTTKRASPVPVVWSPM